MESIKIFRENRKLTQEELAGLINVDRTTISKWETNKASPPIEKLYRLSKALECEVIDFLK